MKYIQRVVLCLLLILGAASPLLAAETSAQAKAWQKEKAAMSKYQYKEPQQVQPSRELTPQDLENAQRVGKALGYAAPIGTLIMFTMIAVGIVAIVLRITKNLTLKSKQKSAELNLLVEEKTSRELTHELMEAVDDGDYRTAVRLQFLLTLSILQNRSLITWTADTTNLQYCRQLQDTEYRGEFALVARAYEDSWYGFKPTTVLEYETIKSLSNKLTAAS